MTGRDSSFGIVDVDLVIMKLNNLLIKDINIYLALKVSSKSFGLTFKYFSFLDFMKHHLMLID